MPTVELLFSALPEHVRTARLVAAAVARRAGVDEAVLDEVRLAVGEACSRAVGLYRSSEVRILVLDDDDSVCRVIQAALGPNDFKVEVVSTTMAPRAVCTSPSRTMPSQPSGAAVMIRPGTPAAPRRRR